MKMIDTKFQGMAVSRKKGKRQERAEAFTLVTITAKCSL